MSEQDIRKMLAVKLHEFRKRAGLTTKEVGIKVGKSEKTVSGWEHGRGQPDADMLVILCGLYNIKNISEFFSEGLSEAPVTEREIHLLNVFRQFGDEGQEKVITYAEDLLSTGRYIKSDSDRMVSES